MRRSSYYLKIPMLFLLVSLTLCGCAKEPPVADSSTSGTEPSQNASTQAEPVTLEQALLKERGKPYDQSDYKKFLGGEGIINEYAEFDCNLDHGYSKTINDLVVADGKLYQANFNSLLANGKNIQEIGTLPGKDVRYWQLTYDGEMGSMYLKDGSGYKISAVPFSTAPLDNAQYPLFKKVYRYAADGKTLEDHTAEYLNADKFYSGDPIITVSEFEIYRRFNSFTDGKTAVYISHRLSSCRFCDKIVVFEKGRIVQTGSHEVLLSDENGQYNALWNAQAKYYITG